MVHLQENDLSVTKSITPDVFEGKFDVKDFVGSISEKLIMRSQADPGPFDPKPFIRTFESIIDKLIAVRKDVQVKTEQMEKVVRVSERDYSRKMTELNRNFETVGQSFSGLENKMSEVGRTAIRIGEQLESVSLERQRAQAAFDLIDYYNQFSKDDTSRIDVLKKEGKEGRRQVAILLRRLQIVAKEVDLLSAEKTQENINKYCEKFEKEMLHLFDRSYRKGDPKYMHHCAQTLLEFNGGASCVQVYVNQHDFFINRVREIKTSDDPSFWDPLSNPDVTPPKIESSLKELFGEIRATVETETQIVQAVFPNPAFVMQVYLQRVFAQSIQQHMEQLLNKSNAISELAYLRVLQLVHVQTSLLVEDLKLYELPSMAPRSSLDMTEFNRSITGVTGSSGTSASTVTTVSVMLETAMEELFVPYTEGQPYLDKEGKSLGILYSGLLANFARYHEKTHKTKSSIFDRMVNQLSAAAANTGSGGPTTSAQAAAALMRFGGISAQPDKSSEELVREQDGELDIDIAEKMLKWHAEAVGRCVELSTSNDAAKNVFFLYRVLADAIGGAYVETAIETGLFRLESADSKIEPQLERLAIVHSVNLIVQLWQQYVNIALLPLASSSVTVRREMVIYNNQTVSRIEGGTNNLMQRLTDAIVSWLASQLAKQKRNDFKPRNDDLSFARVNTEPCIACCEHLEKVRDVAKENLSGKNFEIFMTEVGVAFHGLLLDHLRKFPVSATGGLMLAKDLKSYQDAIASFGIPALGERFEFIRQLGNVFLVRPEILKSYMTENYLGRIDTALLRPYLAQRSDWGQFEKGFNEEGLDGATTGDDGRALKDRFGMARLSTMMKDMEGLKLGEGVSMPTLSGTFPRSFSRALGTGGTS